MFKKHIFLFSIVLLILNCNIFDITNPSNTSTDYLADGQKKYWEQDFEGAVIDFKHAIENDYNNGEAYWWHAKAKIRTTGFTPIALINIITELDSSGAILPFMDWHADSANIIYEALFDINDDLEKLFYDSVFVGDLDRRNVVFDYALSLILHGVLMLRDTDVDNMISSDDVNLGAYFLDGEFYIPPGEWQQLQQVQRIALIDRVVNVLERFRDVSSYISEDLAGIKVDRLRYTVDQIIFVLNVLRMAP